MLSINEDYCKGCGLCVRVCPQNIYRRGERLTPRGFIVPVMVDLQRCIDYGKDQGAKKSCELCVLTCPDQAIRWAWKDE